MLAKPGSQQLQVWNASSSHPNCMKHINMPYYL
jgi:hypothetical protein